VIRTLPLTILVEGIVVLAYSHFRKKSAGLLLFGSVVVNLFTQAALWIALEFFYRNYTVALLTVEFFIWLVESLLMFRLSRRQLEYKSAVVLSFCMNTASFGIGWFLPI
jgi:hypothetical protein